MEPGVQSDGSSRSDRDGQPSHPRFVKCAAVSNRRFYPFTLLDSGGKKIRFVRHVLGELALDNVVVEQLRVEAFEPADLYDAVISRAFSSLGEFVRRCGRLVATGGCLLAMKGRYPDAELTGVPGSWEVTEGVRLEVPGQMGERHMIVMRRQD